MSLRQVFIKQLLSTSQSKDGAYRKPDHLILQIWQSDGTSQPHLYITSGIRHHHCWRTLLLHWRRDLESSHWGLQAPSQCGTRRRWGSHTSGTIPNCSEIANASKGNHSGNILLWLNKSYTYFRGNWMEFSHQGLLSTVESYPRPEEKGKWYLSEKFEDGINCKMVWGVWIPGLPSHRPGKLAIHMDHTI